MDLWDSSLKPRKQLMKTKEPTGKAKLNLTIDLYLRNLTIFKAHCLCELGACLKVFGDRWFCQSFQDRKLILIFLIILAVFTTIAHPVSTNADHIKYISRCMKGKRIYVYNLMNFVSFCQWYGH